MNQYEIKFFVYGKPLKIKVFGHTPEDAERRLKDLVESNTKIHSTIQMERPEVKGFPSDISELFKSIFGNDSN